MKRSDWKKSETTLSLIAVVIYRGYPLGEALNVYYF